MIVDPNKPTPHELIEHNTKIAKANFCTGMVIALVGNPQLNLYGEPTAIGRKLAEIAIGAAEMIFSTYPMTIPGERIH